MVTITIDASRISVAEGRSVLQAALDAGIYIPNICYHPDLPAIDGLPSAEAIFQGAERLEASTAEAEIEGCGLCLVEIEGSEDLVRACGTGVVEGMTVRTGTARALAARRENLSRILARHPHACLSCAQRFGCALEPCSTNVAKEERCCPLFGNCELQKVAEQISIREDTPRYFPAGKAVVENEPLYRLDYNLCIGCTRCVRACNDLRGVGALCAVVRGGRWEVGTIAPTLRESGCRFCGACVEVCPTGALLDKDLPSVGREKALVPCRDACPAGIDVPRYVRLVAQGEFAEAAAVVRETVPLPNVLGRVCYRPCEEPCRRAELDEPVAICSLKTFAALEDDGRWRTRLTKAEPSGKRVAVVGSGPAGLTAAYFLARKGHRVTIFEASPELGGMLRYGIPAYRLPQDELENEIRQIIALGIEVRTKTKIGADVTLSGLRGDGYDAVLLAVGKQQSLALEIEGIDLKGVLEGLEFLRSAREVSGAPLPEPVIVIGGGNVAIDVARSARRLGAADVKIVCLEPREELPAHDWEIAEALEEGAVLHCSLGLKRLLGGNGAVAGLELMRCTSVFDEAGRFAPSYDENDLTAMEAGTVIVAIGQACDPSLLDEETESLLSRRGALSTLGEGGTTAVPGLFACGDAAGDSVNVIEAAASARRAAAAVDSFLGGDGELFEELSPPADAEDKIGSDEEFCSRPRQAEAAAQVAERVADFRPIVTPYGEREAVEEAGRCLQCDLRLRISAVTLPPDRWLELAEERMAELPEAAGVYQLADENGKVVTIKGVDNLRQALMEAPDAAGSARYFSWEEDPMFTKRESEMIQQHLQQFGELPGAGEDDLEDLF